MPTIRLRYKQAAANSNNRLLEFVSLSAAKSPGKISLLLRFVDYKIFSLMAACKYLL